MRKTLFLVLAGLSLVLVALGVSLLLQRDNVGESLSVVRATPSSAAEVARISVQELHVQLQGSDPPRVWELRIAEAYERQHISGSQRVDMDQIAALAGGLDRERPIVILCA